MIPLQDDNQSRTLPVETWILIGINVLAFLYTLLAVPQTAEDLFGFYSAFSVVPREITANPFSLDALVDVLRSMFLHGGWAHILGNMLYLFIFGDNVEDRLGKILFPVFYVVWGFAAAWAQIITSPNSLIPLIGASGAIAGVLGCYLVLYPQARVNTLVIFGFFGRVIQLPAIGVLGFWFVLQLFNGLASVGGPDQGGTAFWAHAGGFVAGALTGLLFRTFTPTPSYQPRQMYSGSWRG